ncbi:MAG: glycoside hydrolase family 97 protein, partial [Ignavibacteriae bacterium]
RRTTNGFEIALSVLFTSGIQHIAETSAGMAAQKDFVREYMSSLPETWDDVKFIDGYPGKFVVIARQKGKRWYIAGINGENSERNITLNAPFVSGKSRGILITDEVDTKDFIKTDVDFSTSIKVTMHPYGGFVMKTILPEDKPDVKK